MNEVRRHRRIFYFLRPFVGLFTKYKFNYIYDDLGRIEGPYLLLANHNLELDPLLVAVAARKHLYFVASEHIMRKGIATKLLMRYLSPIIHMKGRQGINTVKQMLKTLRGGNNVCIFPEGNRSFNGVTCEFEPSIAKVARRSGAKMVTFRIEGGYFSQPRWSTTLRRGRIKGCLVHVYSADELKLMTDEQVRNAIQEDLYEDAYESQKRDKIAFRGKNLALGLETTIFTCPVCGKSDSLRSDSEKLYCTCGFEAVYDVYGDLTDKAGRKYSITELDMRQKQTLGERAAEADPQDLFFSDQAVLYEIGKDHEQICAENGTLAGYTDRFEFNSRKIYFREMSGMAIYSRNCLILHMKGREGHLEIKADQSFCGLKYLYLYNAKEK